MFPVYVSLSDDANSFIFVKTDSLNASKKKISIVAWSAMPDMNVWNSLIEAVLSVFKKWQQKQTSKNKTPHQYLKKGEKRDFFVLFNEYSPLVQNHLCFTFFFFFSREI